MLTLCASFLAGTRLTAQAQLPEPDLRIADARGRASRVRDSIAHLPQEARPTYVRSDTTRGGVTWVQFDRVTRRQATPEAAAAQFLAVYGTPVLGIDATHGRLELLREVADGDVRHFRYEQRHAGYRVLHGQWLVHVRRGARGYAVEAANGWVFPDIGAPVLPSVGRTTAENAAVWGLPRASVAASPDTAPVILAHDGAYRVAYLVSVFDADREMAFTR